LTITEKAGVTIIRLQTLKRKGIWNENIVGNLMIAQYQVDKLKSRLSERIGGHGSASNKKASVHIFKHNEKWYKVTTKVEVP
jgi:hypothetical protein